MSEYKNSYSRVYDEGVDFGQGFDLDYTEAAGRDDSAPVSQCVLSDQIQVFLNITHPYLSLELTMNW